MLGDSAKRHVEVRGDVGGGQLTVPNQSQNPASSRFRNDLKCIHARYFSRR